MSMWMMRRGESGMGNIKQKKKQPRTVLGRSCFCLSIDHGDDLDLDELLGLAELQHREVGRGRLVVVGREVGVHHRARLADVAHAGARAEDEHVHHVLGRCARRLQCLHDAVHRLARLRLEVVGEVFQDLLALVRMVVIHGKSRSAREPEDLAALDLDRGRKRHEHALVVVGMVDRLQVIAALRASGRGGAESVHAYLESRLAPVLIGEDPLFVERLWERMFRADMGIKKQGVAAYALSALDIGLWDIAGKAAGLPLYKLWGAVTDRIPAYGSGGWSRYSERELIAEAEKYAAQGCRHYKMKIHHPDPRENRKRVEAVRRALGEGVRMMVDVNQRLDVLANIRQARSLEDFDLVWYEEPVLADDIAACAEVAHAIRIPVATGAAWRSPAGRRKNIEAARKAPAQRDAMNRARSLTAPSSDVAKRRLCFTSSRNTLRLIASSSQSLSATALARRGVRSTSAISPNTLPGPTASTRLPPTRIATRPRRTTYISTPARPSVRIVFPAS